MKRNYDHPEMDTMLSKIKSAEELNKMKILNLYQQFAGQLNFDDFISPDSMKLIGELLQAQDVSYQIDEVTHWLNQIKGFDEDDIAQFLEKYMQERKIDNSNLSDVDYNNISQGLKQMVAERCMGLSKILTRLNLLQP